MLKDEHWKFLQEEYRTEADRSGYRPGDNVVVVYKIKSLWNGWSAFWTDAMTRRIGETGRVIGIEGCSGIRVEFSDGESFNFPYQSLKRA